MSESKVVQKGGVGLFGWMFLIFLTLKLTGYIAWSWWWVTAPLWGPLAVAVGVMVIAGIIAAVASVIIWAVDKK